MNRKKFLMTVGVIAGVFLGMKYVFPVMLPFFCGFLLAEIIHPVAYRMAKTRFGKTLHLTESGIGGVLILLAVCTGVWGLLAGAEYLTGKIGDCLRYYPVIKNQAAALLEQCCKGVEHMTGISAEKSSPYLCRQIENIGNYFLRDGKGMDTAMESVRCCVVIVGMLMVGIVSSILFLQEREKIRSFLAKQPFFGEIKRLMQELFQGAGQYLKAQLKIMAVICLFCIGGLWILKVRHFLGYGLALGILDAFPVLGTGLFLVPAGIFQILIGDSFQGVGFLILYAATAVARQILEPRLIGNHMGFSPLLVLLSVYLGIFLYGGAGFLLGPLSALLIYGISKNFINKKQ
ncbi:MAG TPA: AI-2E family transporter [Candidatus Blautia stercoravium]|nr:AI-2E family transporter [Candidatus Blautia stercoravium]